MLLYIKLIEHQVVFLSKRLSPAERNYWVTELNVGALVWGISKLRHYLDGDSFTVFKSFLIYALFWEDGAKLGWRIYLSQFSWRFQNDFWKKESQRKASHNAPILYLLLRICLSFLPPCVSSTCFPIRLRSRSLCPP